MSRERATDRLFWLSWAVALILLVFPGPPWLVVLKPFWPGLLACYWALEGRDRMSLGRAFVFGLIGDLVTGALLGEQALRMTVIVYLVLRFRHRLRFFPMGQQALAIFALFLNDRVLTLWIRLLGDYGWPPASFWFAPLTAALLWPWLFLLLDRLSMRGRMREGGNA